MTTSRPYLRPAILTATWCWLACDDVTRLGLLQTYRAVAGLLEYILWPHCTATITWWCYLEFICASLSSGWWILSMPKLNQAPRYGNGLCSSIQLVLHATGVNFALWTGRFSVIWLFIDLHTMSWKSWDFFDEYLSFLARESLFSSFCVNDLTLIISND